MVEFASMPDNRRKRNNEGSNLRNWHMHRLASTTATAHIPAKSGLYAIGHESVFEGLEKERHYAYIGQSQNLRRRIGQHKPSTEIKPILRKYIRDHIKDVKVWYTTDISKSELLEIEAVLIKHFKPSCNN